MKRVEVLWAAAICIALVQTACGGGDGRDREGADSAGVATRSGDDSARAVQADRTLRAAMADSGEWPSYGRDYTNQRYSRLAQITGDNVRQLQLAWKYETGIPRSFEASPVVVGGTMYLSTPLNHVVALDAVTGQKRWEYAHEFGTTVFCCGAVNRGVAVYDGRVYMGTLDAKLVALDARDGRKLWEQQIGEPQQGYAVNLPIVAVDGKVLVGTSGGEYGIRGFIEARDARSGARVWRWHTIPSPEEGGWWGKWRETDPFGARLNRDIAKEKADSARYADAWQRGGGGVWQAPAIDTTRGLVIFTVGNPSPDLDGSGRPGDNLYTNSIVALDYRTGKLRWYFQQIPHDVWDLDPAAPVVLVDAADSAGRMVPAVVQAGKTGWVDMMSREDGRPLRRSDAFVPQDNMFALPTRTGTRMLPGANGGSEWSPAAYDPETGYLFVAALHQPMNYKVRQEPYRPPAMWLGGAFVGTGEPQYGLFSAVDLKTGKIAWQKRLPQPLIGGALATAGGLVFTGTPDKRFLAYDARTGREVWSYRADGGVNAPPITYAVNGRQYIAVAAGGNFQINAPRDDDLLVFALPQSGAGASGGASAAGRADAARADTSRADTAGGGS